MPVFETRPQESVFQLLRELKDDLTELIRQEVALAKRDIAAKVNGLGVSAAFFGGTAVFTVFAAFFICLFLNNLIQTGLAGLGLSAPISLWLAPLLLGMLLAVGGALSALKALKVLRRANPVSAESWRSLQSIKELRHAGPAKNPHVNGQTNAHAKTQFKIQSKTAPDARKG